MTRTLRITLALAAFAATAAAWNGTGHRVIAAIAYDRLTPAARARLDDLMRHHPDYANFTKEAPADPAARARWAFIASSTWPDELRSDARFYDETKPDAPRTPKLPGFPDMGRHGSWHYIDLPFTMDGSPTKKQPPPHAVSEMPRLIREISRPVNGPVSPSYALVWLLHIVGDVHQPLHCTGRFMATTPDGDAGGNFVYVNPGGNLHAVWDRALGTDFSEPNVNRLAAVLTREYTALPGRERKPSTNLSDWIQEGFKLAKERVYTFGNPTGTRDMPVQLPAGYEDTAHRTARTQVAKAGFRLAELLNRALK